MGKKRYVYRLLVEKKGERALGRPRLRQVYNIKIALANLACSDVEWIDLAHDRD
jgi:hypothetical protein